MIQPYIDCARRLRARGIARRRHRRDGVRGRRGHRAPPVGAARAKQRPPNGYAAKFATPYCIAAGFLRGTSASTPSTSRRGRCRRARARRQGALRDRPGQSLSAAPSPATSARASPTAASSRSASRTCAAAPASRCRAPSWRTSSPQRPRRRLEHSAGCGCSRPGVHGVGRAACRSFRAAHLGQSIAPTISVLLLQGRFQGFMVRFMAKKTRKSDRRYTWRDPKTGRTMGVVIADPVVRPRTVSVTRIRDAVRAVRAARAADGALSKRPA